jgi:hypothetical protein
MSLRVLASDRCRVSSAISCIWSRSTCSRRQRASAAASRGETASAVAVTASIWAVSSASSSSGVHSPRSSSASGGLVRSSASLAPVFAALAAAASPFFRCLSTVARWTVRLRANASIDERRRCCKPTTSSPEAACARRVVLTKRFSRAVRYSSSSAFRDRHMGNIGLEIRTGGLNQKRYGSASTQLMSTPTFAPLAFGISIETLGHVLRTLELRG